MVRKTSLSNHQSLNYRFAVRSVDPTGSFTQFMSPWASSHLDEEFYNVTVKAVGETVGDDTKLGALFSTLLLLTPGKNLSEQAKVTIIYSLTESL